MDLLKALVGASLSVPKEYSNSNTKDNYYNYNYCNNNTSRERLAITTITSQRTRKAVNDSIQGEESDHRVN